MSKTVIFYVLLVGVLAVKGHEVILSCYPTSEGEFSSYIASAAIYTITTKSKSTTENAAIFCPLNDESDRFVKMEFIIHGEPPESLSLLVEQETLSRLNGLSMSCCTDDVPEYNRQLPMADLDFYQNTTGTVEYECDGMQKIRIKLDGLKLLKKDLISHSRERRSESLVDKKECTISKKKRENFVEHLGEPCDCQPICGRYMFNDAGAMVCSLCCSKHRWSKSKLVCEECPECSTTENTNPFTKCLPIHNCNRKKIPDATSTNTENEDEISTDSDDQISEKPSSVDLSVGTKAGDPTTLPNTEEVGKKIADAPEFREFPKNKEIEAKHDTSIKLQWIKGSGLYEVKIQHSKDGPIIHTLLKGTDVEITGSIYENFDKTASIIVNSTGSSSWIILKTLGTVPKQSPENVKVMQNGTVVTISWDDYARSSADGVQVELYLENETDSAYNIKHNNSYKDICLLVEGNYTIHVRYYNNIGYGPAVTKSLDFSTEKSEAIRQECSCVSPVVICFLVQFFSWLVIIIACNWKHIRNCFFREGNNNLGQNERPQPPLLGER